MIDANEECDGALVDRGLCNGTVCTCEDFCDSAAGTLSCTPDCKLSFSRCTGGGCEFLQVGCP